MSKLQNQYRHNNIGDNILPQAIHGTRLNGVGGALKKIISDLFVTVGFIYSRCASSGTVKARKIRRLLPGERWTGSLLDEAQGSDVTPNALENDGGRVGIRALVLQPRAAVLLPPLVEFRQLRRAPLRSADFEQFSYTDNCPGCVNARAGRKKAVYHSELSRLKKVPTSY